MDSIKRGKAVKKIDILLTTPIPILTGNTSTTFKYSSFDRGYHVYRDVWIHITGNDSLTCEQEEHNENDKNAVVIIWDFMEMQEL